MATSKKNAAKPVKSSKKPAARPAAKAVEPSEVKAKPAVVAHAAKPAEGERLSSLFTSSYQFAPNRSLFYATGKSPSQAERERLYKQAWDEAREKSQQWNKP